MLIVKKSAAKVHILYYNEECGVRVVKRNAEFLRFFIICKAFCNYSAPHDMSSYLTVVRQQV